MLQHLYIKNYALIDELTIAFGEKLNILTGETGAGKSIILGALGLILGERADVKVLHNSDRKCIIEGHFNTQIKALRKSLEDLDLDTESETILRREINSKGKSRAFINDTPVNLQQLRKIGRLLVDLHRQHETLQLAGRDFQLAVLDNIGDLTKEQSDYYKLYTQWKNESAALAEAKAAYHRTLKDKDYFAFQFQELEEARLEEIDEQEKLESELNILEHTDDLKRQLFQTLERLSETDINAQQNIRDALHALQDINELHPEIPTLSDRLHSLEIELQDIVREIEHISENVESNPERHQEVEDRINLLNRLQQKHQVEDLASLIEIRDKIDAQLQNITQSDEHLAAMEEKVRSMESQLKSAGQNLSKGRQQAAKKLEEQVNQLLSEVALPNASFRVSQEIRDDGFHPNGQDAITFLFSANKGSSPLPVKDVASGGELSRLMLVIKSLLAANTSLPTLIFDEIDAGIAGEAGVQVGAKLKHLADHHQVICITHLPQIASKAQRHFHVFKEIVNEETYTRIRQLDQDGRITEIAKMISGEQLTDAAMASARELIEN